MAVVHFIESKESIFLIRPLPFVRHRRDLFEFFQSCKKIACVCTCGGTNFHSRVLVFEAFAVILSHIIINQARHSQLLFQRRQKIAKHNKRSIQ